MNNENIKIPENTTLFYENDQDNNSIDCIFGDEQNVYMTFGSTTIAISYASFLAISALLPEIAEKKVKPHIEKIVGNFKQN